MNAPAEECLSLFMKCQSPLVGYFCATYVWKFKILQRLLQHKLLLQNRWSNKIYCKECTLFPVLLTAHFYVIVRNIKVIGINGQSFKVQNISFALQMFWPAWILVGERGFAEKGEPANKKQVLFWEFVPNVKHPPHPPFRNPSFNNKLGDFLF